MKMLQEENETGLHSLANSVHAIFSIIDTEFDDNSSSIVILKYIEFEKYCSYFICREALGDILG
jgi:hypothetical protein